MIKNRDLTTKSRSTHAGTHEEAMQAAGIQKFLFDCSFDSEISDSSDKSEELIKEEPEEVVPSFSEEELETARKEEFIKGKEEGTKEAAEGMENSLLVAIGNLEIQFENLFKAQQEAAKSDLDNAILIATSVIRKIFPSLNIRDAQKEVENMIASVMKQILEEPKVSIYIHPDLEPLLNENIGSLVKKTKYRGEITIIANDDLPLGDCNIEWESGGARRSAESLLLEVNAIIEENLKEEPSMINRDNKEIANKTTIDKDIKPEQLGS
mgnify:CR=1 FL=1